MTRNPDVPMPSLTDWLSIGAFLALVVAMMIASVLIDRSERRAARAAREAMEPATPPGGEDAAEQNA